MRNKQKGFTVFELFIVIAFILAIIILCGVGYTAVHFIGKFW